MDSVTVSMLEHIPLGISENFPEMKISASGSRTQKAYMYFIFLDAAPLLPGRGGLVNYYSHLQ